MSAISRSLFRHAYQGFKIKHLDLKIYLSVPCFIAKRHYIKLPEVYSADNDPAPYFFSNNVQNLLKYLTRPDSARIFRKRTNKGDEKLHKPEYKFMTAEELEIAVKDAAARAEFLLQMPPVLKLRAPIDSIVSKDPALTGHDDSVYVFTDISFGMSRNDRLITIRETDGTLKHADHEIRQKMNQIYFPLHGQRLKTPMMFVDQKLLDRLLEQELYEFILDRACVQFEPNDEKYQLIVSQVYQHCNTTKKYDLLRSTRHFGPMAFYFAWHHAIDDLLVELIQTGSIQEAVSLIDLYQKLHPNKISLETSGALSEKILSHPKEEKVLTSAMETQLIDFAFEEECLKCVEEYVQKYSSTKGVQELTLQSFKEKLKERSELQKGLQVSHGVA